MTRAIRVIEFVWRTFVGRSPPVVAALDEAAQGGGHSVRPGRVHLSCVATAILT